MNPYLNTPLFWALVSMLALVGACSVVGSRRVGRHPAAGWILVSIFDLGRVILALPSVEQPRFDLSGLNTLVGFSIFIIGIIFGLGPCAMIRPLTIAQKDMVLITRSYYRYIRNPIYFGELMWCLGWSILHGSIIGVALVPAWWLGLLFLVLIEEESLEGAIGPKYLDYKKKVKGRIIPGLPI